jgi:hypothetical protein
MMTDLITRIEHLLADNQRLQERQIAILQQCEAHLFVASLAALTTANPSLPRLTVAYERALLIREAREAIERQAEGGSSSQAW